MEPTRIARQLARDVRELRFSKPVTHVYNPLEYAWPAHRLYLTKYGTPKRDVVLLGMNPGPWGMAQSGVPFGDVGMARDWLGIEATVAKPEHEHPKRPISGFACSRTEVSGSRLWGWARDTFRTPSRFFSRFFVANYCPLSFMEASGKNRTPDKLPASEREPLFEACDRALRRLIDHLEPRFVIGVGAFAEAQARNVLEGYELTIGRVLHPSPASPLANNGWAKRATAELRALGVEL